MTKRNPTERVWAYSDESTTTVQVFAGKHETSREGTKTRSRTIRRGEIEGTVKESSIRTGFFHRRKKTCWATLRRGDDVVEGVSFTSFSAACRWIDQRLEELVS